MAISLRADLDAIELRSGARRSKNAGQARRLLALAAIYDGASRTQAAAIGGVTLQIVQDWLLKLNATGPEGLIDRKSPGQPVTFDRRSSRGTDNCDPERPHPGGSRRGSLAYHRSMPMGMG